MSKGADRAIVTNKIEILRSIAIEEVRFALGEFMVWRGVSWKIPRTAYNLSFDSTRKKVSIYYVIDASYPLVFRLSIAKHQQS